MSILTRVLPLTETETRIIFEFKVVY
jgi:hypothetical protein